jgi:alpha-1,6-mannosyltransferase
VEAGNAALEARRWRIVSLTPSRRLYILGAVLLAALLICARNFGSRGAPTFLIPLALAGIAYLLAFREFLRSPNFPRQVVVVGLVLAAVAHVPFLLTAPGPDDDIHRYVWDGRLQRHGLNPYLVVPNDPAFATLHTPETRTLNNPTVPTPYPPGAELFFRAIASLHESVLAFKVAFEICDWAIIFVLLNLLRRGRLGEHWVLAYAWHPLLAIEVAASSHIDILGALLLTVSFAALLRHWRTAAAVAFALAVSVKFLPIVLLPLYWKRVRIRDAALAASVFALLYIPFLDHGHIPLGSLGTYIQVFRFNDPVFAALERFAPPQFLVGVAVLVGLLTAFWFRRKSLESADAFAWPMAASLLCAPVVYPWYLLWLLPFLRSRWTLPLAVWTISIIPTYIVWHLRAIGRPWVLPAWVVPLEYGCIAASAAILWLRHARNLRPSEPP